MALNTGYLTSKRTPEAQEMYTPFYAVEPILKYIPKNKKVWCPFDKEWSAFFQMFTHQDYDVERSHIDEGGGFLSILSFRMGCNCEQSAISDQRQNITTAL